jgi:hypothetical protein
MHFRDICPLKKSLNQLLLSPETLLIKGPMLTNVEIIVMIPDYMVENDEDY